jgi:ComF family protein
MARFADLLPVLAGVERLLLPAECLLCLAPISLRDDDALVCGICRARWERVAPPWCVRCGGPVERDEPCTACTTWPPGLTRVRSAVWLDDASRRAVHHLKYDGWWRVADAMALAMRGLEPLTGRLSLIPIPLGSRRFRKRGYNQSERIADALARGTGNPVRDVLRRVRETPSQTALTPEQRAANVAGAFAATAPLTGHCVLVDDVFTTGATLLAAASALEAAGAARVDAVTFARARNAVGQD